MPKFNWNCYQLGVSGLESQNQRRINSKIYLVQRKLKQIFLKTKQEDFNDTFSLQYSKKCDDKSMLPANRKYKMYYCNTYMIRLTVLLWPASVELCALFSLWELCALFSFNGLCHKDSI